MESGLCRRPSLLEWVDQAVHTVLGADERDADADAVNGGRLRRAVSAAFGASSVALVLRQDCARS